MKKLVLLGAAAVVAYAAAGHPASSHAVTSSGYVARGGYGPAQLENLWVEAGGSPATEVNAACHAMQESSGRPQVISSNPDGGVNVGLWQLDTRGKGSGYTISQLQDPLTNARAAVAGTSGGTDWTAWATPGC